MRKPTLSTLRHMNNLLKHYSQPVLSWRESRAACGNSC